MEKTLSLINDKTKDLIRDVLAYTLQNEYNFFCEEFDLNDVPQDHVFTDEQKDFIYYKAWQAWEDLGFNNGL